MTETSVAVIEDIKTDSIINISKEERALVFEILKETTTDIPDTYFHEFEILLNIYIDQQAYTTSSTVIEFILLTLIHYTFVHPIIEIDYSVLKRMKTPPVKITTSFHKVCYLNRRGKFVEFVSPPNNEIHVTGLFINKIILDKLPTKLSYRIKQIADGFADISDVSLYRLQNKSNDEILGFSFDSSLDKEILISVLNKLYKLSQKHQTVNACSYAYALYNNIQKRILMAENTPIVRFLNNNNDDDKLITKISLQIKPTETPFDHKLLEKTNVTLNELSNLFNASFTLYNNIHLVDLSGTLSMTLPLYLLSEVRGRKNKDYSNFITFLENEKNKKIALRKLDLARYREYNKLQNIYQAMRDVFDSKKWQELELKLNNTKHNSNNIFNLISANDTKLVKARIKSIELRIQNIFNNKCPHIKLLRQFRSATDIISKKKLFLSLRKFFKSTAKFTYFSKVEKKIADEGEVIGGDSRSHENRSSIRKQTARTRIDPLNESYISCNNCGFDLICPHIVILEEMLINKRSYIDIRSALSKYVSSTQKGDDYHYCKICAEKISSDSDLDDFVIRTNQSQMNEDIKLIIYEELNTITKYVVTKTLINRKNLEKIIINQIYNYIHSAEKTLIKHKLDTEREIRVKLRLYSNIYIWALIVHITSQNNNIEIGKSTQVKAPGKKVTSMLEFAIKIMVKDKKYIITESGANIDFIKSRIIKAYKQLAGDKSLIVQTVKPVEINYMTLLHDPVYIMLYRMYRISMDSRHKKPVDKYAVETVLGKNIKDVSGGIFEKVPYKEFVPAKVKLLSELSKSDIQTQNLHSVKLSLLKESYLLFMDYVMNGIFREQIYIDDGQINGSLRSYREKQDKFRVFESMYLNRVSLYYNKPTQMTVSDTSSRFKEEEFHLGLLYDEKGNKHIWDTYIYKSGEFTVDQIISALDNGKTVVDDLIDIKSSKTGIKLSETSKLSEKNIRDSLETKTHINNFYIFYKTRCLEKTIHDFANGTCRFCGMKIDYIDNPFSSDARKFYDKYKSKYFKEIKQENDEKSIGENNIAATSSAKVNLKQKQKENKRVKKDFSKWTFNLDHVMKINKEFGINKNVLTFLGLSTGEEWENIKKGVIYENISEENIDMRLSRINSYIVNFIDEYNKFRFFKNLLRPFKDHVNLIETNKINVNELEKLVPIYVDKDQYWNDIDDIRKQNPLLAPQYALNKLYSLVIECFNKNDKNGKIFAKYIIEKIIRNDSLFANANADDIKIFNSKYVTQVAEREAEKDASDLAGDEKEGVYLTEGIDENNKEDVGDTDEPLSQNAFDMEDDNDEEDIIDLGE